MPVDKFGDAVIQRGGNVQSESGIDLSFANETYLRLDGENDITGNLNMSLNKIENLGEPTNPKDATTKEYVDNTKGTGVIGDVKDETATIKANLDFEEKYKIKNLPAPTDEKDAVNREYVDDQINLNSPFSLKNGYYYAKVDLMLGKYKLGGVRDPLQDGEAANKKYVDYKVKNLFLDDNDNIAFGANLDMEGNQVLNLPEPAEDHEPATKKYVDDLQYSELDKRGNLKIDRNININRNRIFSMRDPTKPSEGANKKYVDDTINRRIQEEKDNFLPQDPATKNYVDEAIKALAGGDALVSKEGVFIKENGHYRATAPLDIDNQKIENIPDPVDETDAVNKKYIDGVVENLKLEEPLIRENGGYNINEAYLNMNFNNIRNVGNPKDEADAVPRRFVDDMSEAVEEKIKIIKERKHLIAANANYCGDLIKDDYQFAWGSQSIKTDKIKYDILNGFVIPSNGYIKNFILFSTGIKINGPKDKKYSDLINEIGLNKPFPVFTLVLIRNGFNLNLVDVGTLYFFFKNSPSLYILDEVFKFNPDVDEKTLRTIGAKDIINIRSEFDSTHLSEKRFSYTKHVYPVSENDFHTYNATILIELDPLDD